jgi:hypothetical protein
MGEDGAAIAREKGVSQAVALYEWVVGLFMTLLLRPAVLGLCDKNSRIPAALQNARHAATCPDGCGLQWGRLFTTSGDARGRNKC